MYIYGAKFKDHCSNISRDILVWVLNCFSGTTYDVIPNNTKTWISLKREKIFQKGKRHSSLLWKAFQISSIYSLLHRHFKSRITENFFHQSRVKLTEKSKLYHQFCFLDPKSIVERKHLPIQSQKYIGKHSKHDFPRRKMTMIGQRSVLTRTVNRDIRCVPRRLGLVNWGELAPSVNRLLTSAKKNEIGLAKRA